MSLSQELGISGPPAETRAAYRMRSIALTVGAISPRSKRDLTGLWGGGPSGSIVFMVNVNRMLSLGVGLDASVLQFRDDAAQTRFSDRSTYPDSAYPATSIRLFNIFMAWKFAPLPQGRFSPYVAADIGAVLRSDASYRPVVDEIRYTYYSIPGRTRLSIGGGVGVDMGVSRTVAIELELRAKYLQQDPAFGVCAVVRGGVRISV